MSFPTPPSSSRTPPFFPAFWGKKTCWSIIPARSIRWAKARLPMNIARCWQRKTGICRLLSPPRSSFLNRCLPTGPPAAASCTTLPTVSSSLTRPKICRCPICAPAWRRLPSWYSITAPRRYCVPRHSPPCRICSRSLPPICPSGNFVPLPKSNLWRFAGPHCGIRANWNRKLWAPHWPVCRRCSALSTGAKPRRNFLRRCPVRGAIA